MHLSSHKLVINHKEHKVNFLEMRMTSPQALKLQRISNRGIWLQFSAAEHTSQLYLKVANVQVDNQTHDHVYNVVFAPVEASSAAKRADLQQHSFIELSAIMQQSHGSVKRIKYAQLLVQEFMVQSDLGWAAQFLDIVDFKLTNKKSDQTLIQEDLEAIAAKVCSFCF